MNTRAVSLATTRPARGSRAVAPARLLLRLPSGSLSGPLAALLISGVLLGPAASAPASESQAVPPEAKAAAEELARWMTGTFSSTRQAMEDDHFFDIRLVMVPIWKERDDGPWLYVEQAAAGSLERPYRQRVYQLVPRPDGAVDSVVYTFAGDPLVHAGAFYQDDPLAGLGPAQLEERKGCEIRLRRQDDGTYSGRTGERTCSSDLRGASYATSEVTLEKDLLVSWDRGFDAEGKQVWGAEKGGYRFERTGPVP